MFASFLFEVTFLDKNKAAQLIQNVPLGPEVFGHDTVFVIILSFYTNIVDFDWNDRDVMKVQIFSFDLRDKMVKTVSLSNY